MEVIELIYQQLFFTANDFSCQPMTSQYSQPLAPQTSEQAAAAIYCALSEYTSGK